MLKNKILPAPPTRRLPRVSREEGLKALAKFQTIADQSWAPEADVEAVRGVLAYAVSKLQTEEGIANHAARSRKAQAKKVGG